MTSITIRNIDENVKQALLIRASKNGWSLEQETRSLLEDAITKNFTFKKQSLSFAERINQKFKDLDADELVFPKRQTARELPEV